LHAHVFPFGKLPQNEHRFSSEPISIADNLNQSFENCYGDHFGLAIGNKYFGCTRLGAGRKNSGCSGQNGTIFKTWILTAMVFDSL
jgi:hypothetical protein